MIAAPQTIFIHALGRNFRHYLPDAFLPRTYPIRAMLDAGVRVALSSDAPVVEDDNPLVGMTAAVTRRDDEGETIAPEQAITAAEALYAYTMGGAVASGDEANRGSIEAGKWADLAVLSRNPLIGPPEALRGDHGGHDARGRPRRVRAVMANAQIPRTLGRWDLVLLKIVAIVNINNVPPVAVYGWTSLVLWIAGVRDVLRAGGHRCPDAGAAASGRGRHLPVDARASSATRTVFSRAGATGPTTCSMCPCFSSTWPASSRSRAARRGRPISSTRSSSSRRSRSAGSR